MHPFSQPRSILEYLTINLNTTPITRLPASHHTMASSLEAIAQDPNTGNFSLTNFIIFANIAKHASSTLSPHLYDKHLFTKLPAGRSQPAPGKWQINSSLKENASLYICMSSKASSFLSLVHSIFYLISIFLILTLYFQQAAFGVKLYFSNNCTPFSGLQRVWSLNIINIRISTSPYLYIPLLDFLLQIFSATFRLKPSCIKQ